MTSALAEQPVFVHWNEKDGSAVVQLRSRESADKLLDVRKIRLSPELEVRIAQPNRDELNTCEDAARSIARGTSSQSPYVL